VATEPAFVKKDFYVLVPRDPSLCLRAYAALLHARPVAETIAEHEVASTKNDFAQLTLSVLRRLEVPRLTRPGRLARSHVKSSPDLAIDAARPELASAWLEARAIEGERIGRELLDARVRRLDADARWRQLRERLDAFVGRIVAARRAR
jgi:hypothetical protein